MLNGELPLIILLFTNFRAKQLICLWLWFLFLFHVVFLAVEPVFVYLSGDQVLQGASLVQTGGAFYHHHLFLPDGEEEHQELLIEPGGQLNHPAERGGGRQGEGWGAQEHHCGYGIDAAALKREKEKTERGS